MARQKRITAFPNGVHRVIACAKCLDKIDRTPTADLSLADLNRIEIALRLRVESYQDGGENAQAGMYRGTHRRVLVIIKQASKG